MGWKEITAGTKRAKPVSARIIRAKSGTLGMEVTFEFLEGTQIERLAWVGWLTSAAMENTMRTLVQTLGFNGDESTDATGVLTNKQALNWDQEVDLVVELEKAQDSEKTYPRVKWVNRIGGSGFQGCEPEVVKKELAAVGFKAAFLTAKAGVPSTKKEEDKVPW